MPIYEYKCMICNAEMEIVRPLDSDPERCPKCGTPRSLNRKISRSDFALKGSGWYRTDYANKG